MNYIQTTQTEIGTDAVNAVNAREIHEHLKVKTRFNDWITRTIERYAFSEDVDYSKVSNGKSRKVDYVVTLDMAKELCMVDDNAKGKEYRKYFIKIEKESAKQLIMSPNQITEALALTAQSLTLQDERMDAHNERLVEHTDRLIQLENNVRLTNQQEYELTQTHHRKVYELLKFYGDDADDKALKRKTHAKVWSIFKKHFMLPRYNELPVNKFNDGLSFLNGITLKDMA